MEENNEKANLEENAHQLSTDKEEVDYDAELQNALERQQQAERNREGYEKRKAQELKDVDIEARVQEAIQKALPKLQSSLAEDTVESALNEYAQGNESRKKLIRFHFENSVAPFGTIRERMENAALIADKKTIQKNQQEMAVALHNRQGISNTGLGSSTDGVQVQDKFFSQEQINELKARGWDDKKIQRLKANMLK